VVVARVLANLQPCAACAVLQTFTLGQEVAFDFAGYGNLKLTVSNLSVDVSGTSVDVQVSCAWGRGGMRLSTV